MSHNLSSGIISAAVLPFEENGAIGRHRRRAFLPHGRDRGQQFVRRLIESHSFIIAHERLGPLDELIVTPLALVFEFAKLFLKCRSVLGVEIAQAAGSLLDDGFEILFGAGRWGGLGT